MISTATAPAASTAAARDHVHRQRGSRTACVRAGELVGLQLGLRDLERQPLGPLARLEREVALHPDAEDRRAAELVVRAGGSATIVTPDDTVATWSANTRSTHRTSAPWCRASAALTMRDWMP